MNLKLQNTSELMTAIFKLYKSVMTKLLSAISKFQISEIINSLSVYVHKTSLVYCTDVHETSVQTDYTRVEQTIII